jgi:hypothetical protein
MKKGSLLLLAFLLALGIAFSGFSSVQAFPVFHFTPTPVTPPDPYAVPSNDKTDIADDVIGQVDLPGTIQLSSGKLAPMGFTAGFAQFGGPGLQVSGLVKPATALVCFPFRGYNFKWTGSIYKWDSATSAWVAAATTFPKDGDDVVNWACTSGAGNGIYSLIIWYIGPPEPVATERPR